MTLIPHPPQRALPLHREMERVWSRPPGLKGFLTSVNHSEIGMRFMALAGIYFGIGGILAMLIRTQLATPQGAFLDTALYNQIFTMHGSIMMFLFAIPMLEGLSMYLLPKMLGTRDMAFPRLSAFGWWCYLFGGLILLVALAAGMAPDGGWFMYTPLSSRTYTPGVNADVWLLGVTFVEISAIAAAVEITVTILRLRAPGMRLTQMPLFAWYMLGTSAMMLAGFPPLILGSVLLELERAFDWPFFDVARGGDSLLWQHLFWLFGHPEVYIIFLPAAGAISTILPVMCRTKILGYEAIVAAIVGLVFLSFGLWVHHMFTVGIPQMALAFFSAASTLVAVPTAVQIFAWTGTMWKGTPRLTLPMLHLLAFFGTFVLGGLTGVMLAVVPFNWQAHDTAFVTAHLHYVLIGGFVFPMMAAAVYWLPLMSGRVRVRGVGEVAFALIFIGFHGTFLVMHLTGLLGMPRRIPVYPDNPEWALPNLISTVFSFMMSIGFVLFALDLLLHALFGRRSTRDPWQANTLEWKMALPVPSYNIAALPVSTDISAVALARGEGALPGAPRGRREVLAVSSLEGKAQHVAVLPGNTLLPVVTAAMVGVFVLLMLFGAYILACAALLGVLVCGWTWHRFGRDLRPAQIEVTPGQTLPDQTGVEGSLTRSGMIALIIADASLFGSFLFALGFLSVIAPGWPPPDSGLGLGALVLGGGTLSALAVASGLSRWSRGPLPAALAGVVALVTVLGVAWLLDDPTRHARDALRAAATGYAALHIGIAVLLALIARTRAPATAAASRSLWRLWQDFTLITVAILALLVVAQEVLS
ncbi:cytochrome c oxidase subunit I [Pararhodobacter zhoushanensis]|uniref:cytochrome-c oxidase n=1 Tax=Pararhodobacter zhoushanensis TaxID=2479545 RepID=A0ABT3H1K0_9RHOB|nr:cytochrome c oxidase subunit I [Pararhodobacter zhoushanensis]MCW1933687.1 cytochrome c oxidase subunit I [Pararhodobacter zhoushanensis]